MYVTLPAGASMAREPIVDNDSPTQRSGREKLDSNRQPSAEKPHPRGLPCDEQQRLWWKQWRKQRNSLDFRRGAALLRHRHHNYRLLTNFLLFGLMSSSCLFILYYTQMSANCYSGRWQSFAGVKRLAASMSHSLRVCLFVRTIKPKRLKLQSPNLPHGYSIIDFGCAQTLAIPCAFSTTGTNFKVFRGTL